MKNNPKCNSAYWLYTIRVLNGKKHEFMTKMKEVGIMTSQVHNRNDINTTVNNNIKYVFPIAKNFLPTTKKYIDIKNKMKMKNCKITLLNNVLIPNDVIRP